MRDQETFLVLCRARGLPSDSLRRALSPIGQVFIIDDEPENTANYGKELYRFSSIMSGHFPAITAWSKALLFATQQLKNERAIWFVEDDVAGNTENFRELTNFTAARAPDLASSAVFERTENDDWPHWHCGEGIFSPLWRSFNPLCRLSRALLDKIDEFSLDNHRCVFHEVMFPSLARQHNMAVMDWRRDRPLDCLHTIRYRPEIQFSSKKICHPIKCPITHQQACE